MTRAAQRTAGTPRTKLLRPDAKRRRRSVGAAITAWAERNPRIARVWLFGPRADWHGPAGGLDIALELQPVGDSEESLTVWVAHCDKWRAELQSEVGQAVELDCLDPDGATRSAQAGSGEVRHLLYQRSGWQGEPKHPAPDGPGETR